MNDTPRPVCEPSFIEAYQQRGDRLRTCWWDLREEILLPIRVEMDEEKYAARQAEWRESIKDAASYDHLLTVSARLNPLQPENALLAAIRMTGLPAEVKEPRDRANRIREALLTTLESRGIGSREDYALRKNAMYSVGT